MQLIAELYSADRLLANNAKKGTTTFKSKGKGISIGNSIGSSSVSDDSGSGGWKSSSDGSSVSSSGSSSGSVDGGSGNGKSFYLKKIMSNIVFSLTYSV